MTDATDQRARRRALLWAAPALLALLAVVVGIRISVLRRDTMRTWRATLGEDAVATRATIDEWYRERVDDTEGLAESVVLHSRLGPSARAAHPVSELLEAVEQRGAFVGAWVVDSAARPIVASRSDTLYATERAALVRAIATGRTSHSSLVPDAVHGTAFSIAAPLVDVPLTGLGDGRPAAVLLRSDIVRSFSPWARESPNALRTVLITPSGAGYVAVWICAGRPMPVCTGRMDRLPAGSPPALALAGVTASGEFTSALGEPVIAATRYDSLLGWGIVRRVRRADAMRPFYSAMALEGAFLAAVLALAGMGAFTWSRVLRLRRLREQGQADARLAAVVEASTDGLISLDAEFRITMVNSAVERLFGYPRARLLATPVIELFAPDCRFAIQAQLARSESDDRPGEAGPEWERCVAVRSDGGRFPVHATLARTMLTGQVGWTMGVHDLSERAHAEAFVARQRQVLELIASSPPMRQALDAVIGIVESEAPAVQCAAYELQDDGVILTLVAAPSIPVDLAIATEEMITGPASDAVGTAVFRGEPVFSTDIASDPLWVGSRAYVLTYGVRAGWAIPLRGADGVLMGALAFYIGDAREPTPRELELSNAAVHLASIALASARDAASLRGSEASFRSFVENAPAAIFRETRLGHLVSANAAMVALLGYADVEALVAAGDAGQLYDDDEARRALLASLESSDVVRGVELDWRRADRTRVTVRLSARAYRDDRARVWLWEGYAEDVTPLRQAEQALRRSEKLAAVGQLISGVAHELNNPLSSILHFADDLLVDPRPPGDAEALGVIRDQARRSRAIVRDLLSFVQQRQANVQVVTLGATVAGTVRAMSPAAQRIGVALRVGHLDDVGVLLDRTGLEQIITNLLSNAMHAAGAGGEVRVRTERGGEWCRLVVEDTGPGIAPDVLPRIFDPFFTTKPTGKGTGLGLSVTLGIVQQFGGRIVTEPMPPGVRGTRFVVVLPLPGGGDDESTACARSPAVAPATSPAASASDREPVLAGVMRRMLVIDDEATIRSALRRFFTRRGWRVDEAEDGAAALTMIAEANGGYDLVVSDLRMPGFSGVDLHDHLADSDPGMLRRVIFSTGDVASHEAASFVQRTACPVLQKPFELRTLDEVVARLLEGTVPGGVVG